MKMSEPANLRADAFAGTAEAYVRYRPPYPQALLGDLVARAAAPAEGRLLDLACGPGRVALALSNAFRSVWAVDLEPEMVEAGRREAVRLGANNITWIVGRAEDFGAPNGDFDLITIGEAFHRLDQPLILKHAMGWLKPGGCLATLGGESLLEGAAPWQVTIADIARRWTARAFPQGWAPSRVDAVVGPERSERRMAEFGFEAIVTRRFTAPHAWTLEAIVGYLESTSVCSRRILGDDFEAFAAEMRAKLLAQDAAGRFGESLGFSYTLARKPR
jgi:ubiquinone/menaquinone biosynthesis C-methylase UbiE